MTIHELASKIVSISSFHCNSLFDDEGELIGTQFDVKDKLDSEIEDILTQFCEELIGEDERYLPKEAASLLGVQAMPIEGVDGRNRLRQQQRLKAGLTPPQEGEK